MQADRGTGQLSLQDTRSQRVLEIAKGQGVVPEEESEVEGVKQLPNRENVERELSLGLLSIIALMQGPGNTSCFNAECCEAGDFGTSIEGYTERSSYEGYDEDNP